MYALIQATCYNNNISTRQFFRSAYQKKFGKDMSLNSLHEDIASFENDYEIPEYVIEFVVAIYGQV